MDITSSKLYKWDILISKVLSCKPWKNKFNIALNFEIEHCMILAKMAFMIE